MSDEQVSKGASALQLPPKQTVSVFGRDVPVFDYASVGEAIELEELMAAPPTSGLKQNVEAVAILIRHRLGETITGADLLKEPMGDMEAFEAAVDALVAPFTRSFLKANLARKGRMMAAVREAMKQAGLSTGD